MNFPATSDLPKADSLIGSVDAPLCPRPTAVGNRAIKKRNQAIDFAVEFLEREVIDEYCGFRRRRITRHIEWLSTILTQSSY